ncbi:UNVERIFIED_CONTAM: dockerin type I repeat protein [Acetivibrio alkalicellulosi]
MNGFKRLLSFAIVLCMVLTPILALEDISKVYGNSFTYGDINNDGKIDSTDRVLLRRYMLDIIDESAINIQAADLNGDGNIDSIDYVLLNRYLLEIIDVFPVERMNPNPQSPTIDPPENLTVVSQTSSSATLSWSHSTDRNDISYVIFSENYFLENIETSPHTLDDLIPGQTYEFTVMAVSDEGEFSEESNVCTVTTTASNLEELKEALIHNFRSLGTDYSLVYEGTFSDIGDTLARLISEAEKASEKPFIIRESSIGWRGVHSNLELIFEFFYDDEYSYIARTKSELKSTLSKEMYNRKESVNVVYKEDITLEELVEIVNSIINEDTYLDAAINRVEYTIIPTRRETSGVKLNVDYYTTKEQEEYVDKQVDFIVSKLVNIDMSDHEKQKLIHDYILNFVDYSSTDEYNDPYSALYYGKTKCNGYAMLTYKMLRAAGIENIIVKNEDHAWNVVNIEGNWYHMDTTWNDGKKKGYGFYGYYNLTDDQIIQGPNGLEGRNYAKVDGILCTTNYIDALEKVNEENEGKYEQILKDLEQNEYYVQINDFKIYPSMNLLYNEVLLKEGEEIGLVDPIIPIERYKDSFHWSTSDCSVVTVADGVITANGEGVAVISAQPMFDPLFKSSIFCIVRVIPKQSNGSTAQNLSRQKFTGFTDQNVVPHVKISSDNNVNDTTTVTNVSDQFEGKMYFYGEPIEIRTTTELDWLEISFELSQEQLNEVDINDMVIYRLDEDTGEMVPQATRIDDNRVTATVTNSNSNGMVSAQSLGTVLTNYWIFSLSTIQAQNRTVNIAFVIDSEYSNEDTLDTFRINITNTLLNLMEKTNIRVVFIESRDGENIEVGKTSFPRTDNEFAKHNLRNNINSYFSKMTARNRTPDPDGLLGKIQSGLLSGSEMLDEYKVERANQKEYALFYTRHSGYFSDVNAIIKEMGNTTGLIVGRTVAYYDSGRIAYNEGNTSALVNFLMDGNTTQLTNANTGQMIWKLQQGHSNNTNDLIVLQKLLVSRGYMNPTIITYGNFCNSTVKAVENFQRDQRIKVTGIVNKETWKKLVSQWDEKNAHPNRASWTYNYILSNYNFLNSNPKVTLTSPSNGAQLEIGEVLRIKATGENCHHLAVFINDEWVYTLHGEGNYAKIDLEYNYKMQTAGKHNIQVKGRTVPTGGMLAESRTIEVQVAGTFTSNYNVHQQNYTIETNLLENIRTNMRARALDSKIEAVVIHWIGPYPNQRIENTRHHFSNVYASAHYLIGHEGRILKIVPDDMAAYTSGGSYYTRMVLERFTSNGKIENIGNRVHDRTLNIEVVPIDTNGNFGSQTYTALVRFTADKLKEHGLNVETGLLRHHDFTTKDCPKIFINEDEAWKSYIDSNSGVRMGYTPSENKKWEEFKSDVKLYMNMVR